MEKVIAVDPGKFEIKVACYDQTSIKKISFPAKLYSLKESEYYEPQGNSIFITYKGKQYIIGDQGYVNDLSLKKDTILHKIGLLAGLSKFINSGDIVHLILGCPASIYKDKNARKAYKDYMVDNSILSFETNDKKYDITIISTLVLPESSGAPYAYPEVFSKQRIAVLDIGGLNVNFAIFDDFIMDLSSMHTINFGGYELEDRVLNTLSGNYTTVLNHDDYIHIIKNNGLKILGNIVPESRNQLDNIKRAFVQELFNKIKGFNYDLSILNVFAIGGTSNLLKNQLQEIYPHIVIEEDAKWANVEGFAIFGKERYL